MWNPTRRRGHRLSGTDGLGTSVHVASWALVLWLLAAAPASGQPASADSASQSATSRSSLFSAGGDAVAATSYVWRGFLESDQRCFQPGAWISVGPIVFDAWMNLEVMDDGLHNAEYDLSLFYTRDIPRATITAGLTNYFFDQPEGRERHSELAVMLATDLPLNPAFEAYYSVSEERGVYASAALSYPRRLSQRILATAEAALGYNHRMWVDSSGFSDVRGTLRLSLERPAQRFQIDVALEYNHGLVRDVISNKAVMRVGITMQ
ncbi:MAG: hypothetical protein Q7V01_05295 [Vicinamibacterales bacterium]|nr:hypothetical protein [Vicinamibacterales bacterium]